MDAPTLPRIINIHLYDVVRFYICPLIELSKFFSPLVSHNISIKDIFLYNMFMFTSLKVNDVCFKKTFYVCEFCP